MATIMASTIPLALLVILQVYFYDTLSLIFFLLRRRAADPTSIIASIYI
jgi:hypothetical protein